MRVKMTHVLSYFDPVLSLFWGLTFWGNVVLYSMKKLIRDTQGRIVACICPCGAQVQLGAFTCECDRCGQLYNWAGQMLRPVEQWEEDY